MDLVHDAYHPVLLRITVYSIHVITYFLFLFHSSVLKTFIHDPLVEWEKVKGRPASAEATNEKVKLETKKYMACRRQMNKSEVYSTVVTICRQ